MKPSTLIFFAPLAGAVNITTLLKNTPDLSTLTSLVTQFPDILSTLTAAKNITILAPTNAAFSKALEGRAGERLKNDKALLKALLTYHVISSVVPAAAAPAAGAFIPTLLTDAKYSSVTGGQRVGGAAVSGGVTFTSGAGTKSKVTKADIAFDGGIVHVIDTVLSIPPTVGQAATNGGLTSLAGSLDETDLLSVVTGLKDITVFAPTNAAFAAVAAGGGQLSDAQLKSILTYHVINGTVAYSPTLKDGAKVTTVNGATLTVGVESAGVRVGKAKVVQADILVKNGVVHVIDTVLTPS